MVEATVGHDMLMKSTWRENETMFFTSLEITMTGIPPLPASISRRISLTADSMPRDNMRRHFCMKACPSHVEQ